MLHFITFCTCMSVFVILNIYIQASNMQSNSVEADNVLLDIFTLRLYVTRTTFVCLHHLFQGHKKYSHQFVLFKTSKGLKFNIRVRYHSLNYNPVCIFCFKVTVVQMSLTQELKVGKHVLVSCHHQCVLFCNLKKRIQSKCVSTNKCIASS